MIHGGPSCSPLFSLPWLSPQREVHRPIPAPRQHGFLGGAAASRPQPMALRVPLPVQHRLVSTHLHLDTFRSFSLPRPRHKDQKPIGANRKPPLTPLCRWMSSDCSVGTEANDFPSAGASLGVGPPSVGFSSPQMTTQGRASSKRVVGSQRPHKTAHTGLSPELAVRSAIDAPYAAPTYIAGT